MLNKGPKGAASITTDDLYRSNRRTRNHHALAFQTTLAGNDIYKSSFLPQTIREFKRTPWQIPLSLLLNVQKVRLSSLLLLWGLGTNSPNDRFWWMIVFECITSKQFWFWFFSLPLFLTKRLDIKTEIRSQPNSENCKEMCMYITCKLWKYSI